MTILNKIKQSVSNLTARTSDSWGKRKSIILGALCLYFITHGIYHIIADFYGWMGGWITFGIVYIIIGVILTPKWIKLARQEFKAGGWDVQNTYMLTRAYEKRLKEIGLDRIKWSNRLSKGYVWQCAERELLFRRLEKEGKLQEVLDILQSDKLIIAKLIKDISGEDHEAASFIDAL
jgi:hypothetical protein